MLTCYDRNPAPTITYNGIERLAVFQTKGDPEETPDHSRQPQKLMMFDCVNGLFYHNEGKLFLKISKTQTLFFTLGSLPLKM